MTFGEEGGWDSSVAESERVLQAYLDRGGNFIDTANFYTNGHMEKIVGDFLATRPGLRDRLVLASKFFGSMHPGDPNGGGAGRKAIVAQLEQSLRRMQTDHLDLYWLHNWDAHTPIEETMRALDDLVTAGKIRYVGFSNTPAWVTAQASTLAMLRAWTPVIALQVEYSRLARTVEGELIPLALDAGMGVRRAGAGRLPAAAGERDALLTLRAAGGDARRLVGLLGIDRRPRRVPQAVRPVALVEREQRLQRLRRGGDGRPGIAVALEPPGNARQGQLVRVDVVQLLPADRRRHLRARAGAH
jgi:hypothetical protein